MGSRGKVLVVGGAIGVASMRSCEKLPPCLIKPVSAGSKTDLPLAKAKPISNSGSASVITYLRKGRKKTAVKWQWREGGVRWCERNNSADTQVSEEGRGGGAWDTGAEGLPLQLMMKTMVRQVVALKSTEIHGGADITCSLWKGPHAEAGGCLKEAVTPWGDSTGAGLCQDLRTRGERSPCRSRFVGRACDPMGDPCWSSLLLKDCTPWKGPTLGKFLKSCSPWEGLTLEKLVENCLLWEGPHAGAGEECEESSPWGGRSGRDNVCWTDRNFHAPSPLCFSGGGGTETGVKLSPERREGWGEGVLRSGFISRYPTLIWLVMN